MVRSSKQLEPQLAKYAELQAQKALGEQVDAFLDSLEKKRNEIEKERANSAEYIGSAVSRGVLTIDEAQTKMSESTLKYVERMTDAIKKLDEIINSDAFNKLSPEQQTAILNQREQLGAGQADYASNPRRQAANFAVDSMAKRLDDFLQRKRQFEELQEQLVISGQQSITKMEENVQAYLDNISPQMKELVADAQKIMASFGDSAAYANLTNLVTKMKDVRTETTHSKGEVELMNTAYGVLNDGAMTAFEGIASGLAGIATGAVSSREAFANLGQAMAQWAAEALRHMAKVIIQQLISLAIQKALQSYFGGGGSDVQMPDTSSFGQYASLFHTGGVVGRGKAGGKRVNPLVFNGAVRYHSGGIAGLAPNEVPAVLQKGEEVITKNDPRHRDNANSSSSNQQQLTVINTFDPVEAMNLALASSSGRKVLIKAMGRERRAVKRIGGA